MYYKQKMKFCTSNALYKFLCNRFVLPQTLTVGRLCFHAYSPIHSSTPLVPTTQN